MASTTTGIFELLTGSSTPFLESGDVVCFVDVSDTTQAPQGSLVKGTLTDFFGALPVPVVVTSASANALAVGLNGATNPAFQVDASTALQVAGLKVTGAVTGGTVALVTTDSGAATNLTINAKGTGTIGIGSVSTGRVTITPATTITGALTLSAALTYGGVTLSNAVTGTGNMVLSASPTLSGTVGGALTFSGALTLSAALTYGGVTLSNAVTGTGNMVLSASPTFTGTATAATLNATTLGGTLSTASQPNITTLASALTTGTINGQTISATASFTGTVDVAGLLKRNSASQASIQMNYTGTGAINASLSTFNDSAAWYDETAARYILQYTASTNTLSRPTGTFAVPGTLALAGGTVSGTPTWSSSQAITLSTASQPNITTLGGLTSVSTLVGFGGTSSSFPALKRSGTKLVVRLADDSNYGDFEASNIIFGAVLGGGASTGASIAGANILLDNVISGPSGTPVGGGCLYVQAGALKYIGTSGTITTIAPA